MSDDGLLHDRCHVDDGPVRAGKAVRASETPETDAEVFACGDYPGEPVVDHNVARRLERERNELRDKALRFDLDQAGIKSREREAVELVQLRAERDALHVNMMALAEQRDDLREALQAAMLDCDHLILKWPSNPYEWQIGVSKIQKKLRAILAAGRVT